MVQAARRNFTAPETWPWTAPETFTVRKVTASGSVVTVAHLPDVQSDLGEGERAGIAVDRVGNVFISEPALNRIVRISAQGSVSVYAGSMKAGRIDGPVSSALFSKPRGLAFDKTGNLYVADAGNCSVRRITADGVVTTIAGGPPGEVDGPISTARFEGPTSLAIDNSGNIYVAEFVVVDNEERTDVATALRRIGVDSKVTTLGENAYARSRTNRVSAAHAPGDWFDIANHPSSALAIDSQGIIYWTTRGSGARIEGIDSSQADSFIGPANLGIGDSPQLPRPRSGGGIAVDGHGNVYVSDTELEAILVAAPPFPGLPRRE
jgi:hypothetical protein